MIRRPVAQHAVSTDEHARTSTITHAVYALQALSFVLGLTFVAGAIVNYLKLDEVRGTWLESHFRWQIRTFWFGLLWGVVGSLTVSVVIGYAVLLANAVWVIYRIARGWMTLHDGRAMYAR